MGVVIHSCNRSIGEAEAGEEQVGGHMSLYNGALPQKIRLVFYYLCLLCGVLRQFKGAVANPRVCTENNVDIEKFLKMKRNYFSPHFQSFYAFDFHTFFFWYEFTH